MSLLYSYEPKAANGLDRKGTRTFERRQLPGNFGLPTDLPKANTLLRGELNDAHCGG
jgi:hypothetical protein